MRRKLAALFIAALMMIGMAGTALADPPPPFTTVCLNPAGNEVRGQCQGEALDEINLNPAGKAPPGQN